MNLLKAAHKLTKEIKKEYPEVDYKFQLGLCMKFLYKKGEDIMVELKGSEKQVKWATDIRKEKIEGLEHFIGCLENYIEERTEFKKSKGKEMTEKNIRFCFKRFREADKYENGLLISEILELKEKMLNEETSSVFYIDNRVDYPIEMLRKFREK